jgi:hypothetical protein
VAPRPLVLQQVGPASCRRGAPLLETAGMCRSSAIRCTWGASCCERPEGEGRTTGGLLVVHSLTQASTSSGSLALTLQLG